MTSSPHWALFARVQRATDHHQISPRYWAADEAADAALDLLFQAPALPLPDIANKLNVLAGNRTAKHRRRSIALAEFAFATPDLLPSAHDGLCARQALERIRARVSDADWRLAEMVGLGHSHGEIADALGLAEGTVKNRLSQLRRRLLN